MTKGQAYRIHPGEKKDDNSFGNIIRKYITLQV